MDIKINQKLNEIFKDSEYALKNEKETKKEKEKHLNVYNYKQTDEINENKQTRKERLKSGVLKRSGTF